MEAIVLLIVIIVAYKIATKRKLDKMSSDERIKYEWDKIKKRKW